MSKMDAAITAPDAATTTAVARLTSPETYLLFDRADDESVIARIRGASLKAYVYHFKQGGQEIYGLGIDGAEARPISLPDSSMKSASP